MKHFESNSQKTLGLTQVECAEKLGISRERVAQIERQAILKLRELVKPEFKDYFVE